MSYWNKICGFIAIFLMITFFSIGQANKNMIYNIAFSSVKDPLTKSFSSWMLNKKDNNQTASSIKIINEDYYTRHFGYFCKKELALEKFTKVPLKIRLGSVQQCDYLEGKK